MNENKVEGKFDQAKGNVKDAVGKAVGDDSLRAEGAWDKIKGGAKEALGTAQDAVHDARTDADREVDSNV